MSYVILAIESSCDDTSASVISDAKILSNVVSSQIAHKDLGGVVPELASRKHLANIDSVIKIALDHALGLDIPLIEVNHMEAHILAHFIDDPKPKFPFLCLTVSGGHTEIVKVDSPFDMKVLGKTIDDAAGEAFDKSGKILGLSYPAGPIIDKLAKEGQPKFGFTKPKVKGLDFSFSGLKTGILYFLRKEVQKDENFIENELNNICASIQHAIIEILMDKITMAIKQTGITQVAIAGGVSANSGLRAALNLKKEELGWEVFIPKIQYCTDNAAMIAMSAHFKFEKEIFSDQSMRPDPRLKIDYVN